MLRMYRGVIPSYDILDNMVLDHVEASFPLVEQFAGKISNRMEDFDVDVTDLQAST
jgi:small nuclear ribonucleoprotein (snRNP)-like protein